MKIRRHSLAQERGSALAMVLVLSVVSLLILASIVGWSSTNATLSHRTTEYYRAVALAEAATEKVITHIAADYQKGGDAEVKRNVESYKTKIPTEAENPMFKDYQFSDGKGGVGQTHVEFLPPSEFRVLSAQYRGLHGYSSAFRVVSNARDTASRFDITGAVRQDIEVATIPLFQFAIFYNLDLEINPSPPMAVTGPVHGNGNIYLQPHTSLTFEGDVTAAGEIINGKKEGDCTSRPKGTINFMEEHDSGVSTLNLPIGVSNSPAAVRQVVEVPDALEDHTGLLGKQRFYNKADMIIRMRSDGTFRVTSGRANAFSAVVPQAQWDPASNSRGFLSTGSFYNRREQKTVRSIDININRLRLWSATNTVLPSGEVTILYVYDERNHGSSHQPGVRLLQGTNLPARGLTVATPLPIYVNGDYNVPVSALGTHDTGNTKPAALIGDAITVLSGNWNDANSSANLSSRVAANTTVNAAFLAGIVQTVSCQYSGGVENFPRFLEDWSGKTFTYNGSMVVMYDSKHATNYWTGTGVIYNPPTRKWAFDKNFRDPAKLPPGTPSVRTLIRSSWAMVKPNSTTVVTP
jgi:hypothetical protein